jgi:hypothetical protein
MSRYYSLCFMGIVYCIFVIICTLVFGGRGGLGLCFQVPLTVVVAFII